MGRNLRADGQTGLLAMQPKTDARALASLAAQVTANRR